MLTAVAGVNNAIDVGDAVALTEALKNEEATLEGVDDGLGLRYLSHFVAVKNEKREVCCLHSPTASSENCHATAASI